jgi:hypothetical protein
VPQVRASFFEREPGIAESRCHRHRYIVELFPAISEQDSHPLLIIHPAQPRKSDREIQHDVRSVSPPIASKVCGRHTKGLDLFARSLQN